MFCHKWQELTLCQADAQYKALEGEHTPHYQIWRVNYAQGRLEGGENQF